jgi:PPOX class probable F420-dependent enzyme
MSAAGLALDADGCRRRFGAAAHAYLATAGADQAPHLVPVTFALVADEVVVVVDHKPKRTAALRRLRNIRENPRVCFLVDEYAADWARLWWVRADARAQVIVEGTRHDAAVAQLQARYPQYRDRVPTGPVIVARVHRWTGWLATLPGEGP